MERQKFEDSWKEAFDQAEVSPSENIWTNIELEIEKAKGNKLKKRLMFYQLLAAASVIFSVGAGIGIYWIAEKKAPAMMLSANVLSNDQETVLENANNNKKNTNTGKNQPGITETDGKPGASRDVSHSKAKRHATPTHPVAAEPFTNPAPRSEESLIAKEESLIAKADGPALVDQKDAGNDNDAVVRDNMNTGDFAGAPLLTASTIRDNIAPNAKDPKLITSSADENTDQVLLSENTIAMPSLVKHWQPRLHLPEPDQKADPVALMLARLEEREREVQEAKEPAEKKEVSSEKLWTSLGFAAGSFNSTNAGVSGNNNNATLAMNRSIANEEVKAPGTTYSVGVNVGTRLSQRWVFQGGVNYLTQSSDYTANTAVRTPGPDNDHASFRPQSINELEKLETAETLSTADSKILVTTAPYNVNNNIRYLSIPMQAGYLIVNRTIGLQLNAGISTDLFLQNTVTADGQNLDNTSQRRGEDSPYRSVNFSGLMGTEVSYRFGTRYRLSLNPGIRYPFNSIYKSNLDIKAMPLTFDIGLRFRYIFH